QAAVTLFTAMVEVPGALGRIVRDDAGHFQRIVEAKDAQPHELAIHEINAGVYCFDIELLRRTLPNVTSDNAQGEFYLPDVVAMAIAEGLVVEALPYPEPTEVLGINSRLDLAHATAHARRLVNAALMGSGVTFVDPAATYVESGVQVGGDTVLHPGVYLRGTTRIGAGCEIGPYSTYFDTEVEAGVRDLGYSHIEGCRIATGSQIGPFSRLRPGTDVGQGARVGNFVEVKKSRIGTGSKVSHLSYIGDTEMGSGVNVGDGANKHRTVIDDGVFIGSDTQLVAPVTVGAEALIGAGTTVTEDVPPRALCVSRAPQKNVPEAGKKYLDRACRIAAEKKKRGGG
ncbi:MAG: bifunctional UDP-N-acetylglucosamine diphosphorylase/glucosamine-1-phosphate N-acetyltransferase GlmU, partial [Nitrospirota bacterium]